MKKVKRFNTKLTQILHEDDWNSRFWVNKPPEYKAKSAVRTGQSLVKSHRAPYKLPKIQSAHVIDSKTQFSQGQDSSIKTLKLESDSESKSEIPKENEILVKNQTKRPSKLQKSGSIKERNSVVHKDLPNLNKIETQRPSKVFPNPDPGKNPKISIKKPEEVKKVLETLTKRPSFLKPAESPTKFSNSTTSLLPQKLSGYSSHSSSNLLSRHSDIDDFFDAFEIKEISSESEEDEIEIVEFKLACEEVRNDYIITLTDSILSMVYAEASKEILSAALVLFSSSVLDKYIREYVEENAPKVARETHNEYKNNEYTDSRMFICKDVFEEEIRKVVNTSTLNLISHMLMQDYACCLPLEETVVDAIGEEIAWNKEIEIVMGNHLVDCLIEEEWVEVLAEDEINSLRMEQIWKLLPVNLQKEMSKKHFHEIADKLSEHLYFDMLNEIVGGVWTESLVMDSLNYEEEQSLESIMPIKTLVKLVKKP